MYSNHITDRQKSDAARGSVGAELREQLRTRLRLMADFATLGAYELTTPDGDDTARADRACWQAALGGEALAYARALADASGAPGAAAASSPKAPRARGRLIREAPPKRVLLFAKVASARCRQRPAEEQALPCGALGAARGPRSADEQLQRRGGSVRVPEQPCTWTGLS